MNKADLNHPDTMTQYAEYYSQKIRFKHIFIKINSFLIDANKEIELRRKMCKHFFLSSSSSISYNIMSSTFLRCKRFYDYSI